MSKLDQSLDSIIATNRQQRQKKKEKTGKQRTSGAGVRRERDAARISAQPYQQNAAIAAFAAQLVSAQAAQAQAAAAAKPAPAPKQITTESKKITGDTIHISGLAKDIKSEEIKGIFENVGPIKSALVHCNEKGVSLGTGQVTFVRKNDAATAVDEYDGALVDSRTISVKLIASVSSAPVVVKKNKPAAPAANNPFIAPIPNIPFNAFNPSILPPGALAALQSAPTGFNKPQNGPARGGRTGRQTRSSDSRNESRSDSRDTSRSDSRGRGGRGRGRGGRVRQGKEVSASDLDAELDAYQSSRASENGSQ